MNIPECKTWKCGRYTVHATLRRDNPAFQRYVIVRKHRVVGESFSCPDAAQCEAIERFTKTGLYVEHSAEPKKYSYRLRGVAATQRGRPTNAARAQAADDLLKIPDDA